jgi:hypothetical protein
LFSRPLQTRGIRPACPCEGDQDVVSGVREHGRHELPRAAGVARRARHELREILRHHAHAALDLVDALLRNIDGIAIAQRLVDSAVTDREHDGGDEQRHHDFDDGETADAHQELGAPVRGCWGGVGVLPGPPG